MMVNNTLTLKVKEALPKDVGRAIVRIDPEDMKLIGLEVGDIIEIEGKRKTPAKAMPCYAENRGGKIIQMDGISMETWIIGQRLLPRRPIARQGAGCAGDAEPGEGDRLRRGGAHPGGAEGSPLPGNR